MIRVSVSNLDKYAAYLNDEEFPLDLLLRDLRGQTPRTSAMERGHAFAKAMEKLKQPTTVSSQSLLDQMDMEDITSGDRTCAEHHPWIPEPSTDMLVAEGHAFAFTCDAEIETWPRRELKAEKDYGGIIVLARCDRLRGNIIADDKTTASFTAGGVEKYIDKWQWRYYLDIFNAHEFVWHIWECREIETDDRPGIKAAWNVFAHHVIRNYRYPELGTECREFAHEYKQFAEQNGI